MTVERDIQVKASVYTAVPGDVSVVLDHRGGRRFRVTQIQEFIIDGVYSVCLTGPILTNVGRDHARHSGLIQYASPEDLPAELRLLPAGPENLRTLLREAGAP